MTDVGPEQVRGCTVEDCRAVETPMVVGAYGQAAWMPADIQAA